MPNSFDFSGDGTGIYTGNSLSYGGSSSGTPKQPTPVESKDERGDKFSNYKIDTLSYPHDLESSPEFSGQKVVFFINVAADSKQSTGSGKNARYGGQNGSGIAEVELFDIPDADVIKSSGTQLNKLVSNVGDATNAVTKHLGIKEIKIAKMKRLSTAIALHMPGSLVSRTGVGWSEKDLVASNEKFMMAADVFSKGSMSSLIGGAALSALRGKDIGQKATRITPGNTGVEMLFEGVDFRTMNFSYSFAPRNKREADNVMRIIRTFKYHMLPEYKSESEFLYIYPSEFQIKYYTGSKENLYIDKQLTAVLQNISVDYAPLGQFATFKDGMPQKINISMEFKEIGTVSKELASTDGKHGV